MEMRNTMQCGYNLCSKERLRNSEYCFECYQAEQKLWREAEVCDAKTRGPTTALALRPYQEDALRRAKSRAGRSDTSRWLSSIGTGMMSAYMQDRMSRIAARTPEQAESNKRSHETELSMMGMMALTALWMQGGLGKKKDGE